MIRLSPNASSELVNTTDRSDLRLAVNLATQLFSMLETDVRK
jgi:hypothetical protein